MTSRSSLLLTVGVVGVLALTACSAEDAPAADPAPAAPAAAEATAAEDAPTAAETDADTDSAGAVITCAEIEPLAAPITAGFALSPDDSSEDATSTSCVWVNDAVASASTDLTAYATLSVTVDGTTWSADELATVPGVSDDPRAATLGGRILILGEGETLGEVGSVQVLYPRGTVTVVATGAMLTVPEAADMPVDDVIGVAVDVAELRD
ncbi:hypothetical protein [Cellulomonas taurus]|uniref:hypothetical protein n=1 Tax=Cellulomonas taurus TaxID=2729175 RepID=UPI00145F868E|nr:hypothetical protein [Cellulomonas taurus]